MRTAKKLLRTSSPSRSLACWCKLYERGRRCCPLNLNRVYSTAQIWSARDSVRAKPLRSWEHVPNKRVTEVTNGSLHRNSFFHQRGAKSIEKDSDTARIMHVSRASIGSPIDIVARRPGKWLKYYMYETYEYRSRRHIIIKLRFFLAPGGTSHPWVNSSRTHPEACLALTGALFNMSKMRAHVAADARVTSGALYL